MSGVIPYTFPARLTPYKTIVADPPWPYNGGGPVGTGGRGADFVRDAPSASASERYDLMSLADLAALNVPEVASENAHLYLWTTNSFMVEAHDLCRAWGFKPKTILTWTKTHQKDPTRVSMKTGYYFRGATEHIIFGVRGSLPLQIKDGVPTGFLWSRIGKHSVKPEAFFDVVERVSPGPYLELFARQTRPGWDVWGNEVSSDNEIKEEAA